MLKKMLALIALSLSVSTNAAMVSLDINSFSPSGATYYSGFVSYDDSTLVIGVGPLDGFEQYDVVAFSFTYNNGGIKQSWSLSDFVPYISSRPKAVIDPLGTVLIGDVDVSIPDWAGARFVNSSGYTLELASCLNTHTGGWCKLEGSIPYFAYPSGATEVDWGNGYVVAPVPVPAAAWLFGPALIGVLGGRRLPGRRGLSSSDERASSAK